MQFKVDTLPSTQYFDKLSINLSAKGGTPDVFMTGPYVEWPMVKAGFMEPLDKYLNDSALTDADWYDKSDFFPFLWQANVWDGKSIGPGKAGSGSVWAVPVQEESYILAYRKDLFQKYGIKVPQTYPELYDAAKRLHQGDVVGMTARGFKQWDTLASPPDSPECSQGGSWGGPARSTTNSGCWPSALAMQPLFGVVMAQVGRRSVT